MIVVKLLGGLGNQMFQYAAGKALATLHNTSLKLDTSFLQKNAGGAYTQRHYELDVFKLQASLATQAEVEQFPVNAGPAGRWLQRYFPSGFKRVYAAERSGVYFRNFTKLPATTYLDGFWQNENYFKDIRKTLLDDFQLVGTVPEPVEQVLQKINSVNSIAMHVRRGDYVTNPSAAAFHGTCSVQYYQEALRKIASQTGPVEVFVFSDDVEWCRTNLKTDFPLHLVSHNEKACWDLFLMSRCHHNVIANSSFSWWGAWLNTHPNKQVIAPEYWFNGVQSKSTGILAQDWQTQANA